jgi:hypothetical protein
VSPGASGRGGQGQCPTSFLIQASQISVVGQHRDSPGVMIEVSVRSQAQHGLALDSSSVVNLAPACLPARPPGPTLSTNN